MNHWCLITLGCIFPYSAALIPYANLQCLLWVSASFLQSSATSSATVTCGLWALCMRPLFIVTLRKNITWDKYFICFREDNVVTMFLIEQSIWCLYPKLRKFFVYLPSAQAKFQPLFIARGEWIRRNLCALKDYQAKVPSLSLFSSTYYVIYIIGTAKEGNPFFKKIWQYITSYWQQAVLKF